MKKNLITLSFFVLGAIQSIAQVACQAGLQADLSNCPDINFIDSSIPGGGPPTGPATIVSWDWDFGDGNTSTTQEPMHTYTANGDYVVCLSISTDNGCTSTICDTVTIACIALGYEELSINKKLVKIVDLMGRETDFKLNTPLIYIYDDGTRERVMKLND